MRNLPGAPWVCQRCGYRINGGADEDRQADHECDERTVSRRQGQRLVTPDEMLDLQEWWEKT